MSNTAQSAASTRIASLLDANSFVEIGGQITARSTDFNLSAKETLLTWVIIVTRMVSLIRCARLLGRFRCGRGLRRCYGRLRRRRDLGR